MKDCTPAASTIVSKIGAPVQADVTANKSSLLAMADGVVVGIVANLLFGWLVKILPTLLGWAIDAALDFFGDVTISDLVTMIAQHKQQSGKLRMSLTEAKAFESNLRSRLLCEVPPGITLNQLATWDSTKATHHTMTLYGQPPMNGLWLSEPDDRELRSKLERWTRLIDTYHVDPANDLAKTIIPEMEKRGYISNHSSIMVGNYAYFVNTAANTKYITRIIWNPTL